MTSTNDTETGESNPIGSLQRIDELFRTRSAWANFEVLSQLVTRQRPDIQIRGYLEIVRNQIVRDLLGNPRGLEAIPRLSGGFLNDYGGFNLSAQEGYLISLIDGRLTLQQMLRVSPFDSFTTLFYFAKLIHQKAITI